MLKNVEEVQKSQQSNNKNSSQDQQLNNKENHYAPEQSDVTINSKIESLTHIHHQSSQPENTEPQLINHQDDESKEQSDDEPNNKKSYISEEEQPNKVNQFLDGDDEQIDHDQSVHSQGANENSHLQHDNFDQNNQILQNNSGVEKNETFIEHQKTQSHHIQLDQIKTEKTEQKQITQQTEDNSQPQEKMMDTQDALEKFKQIISSPKTRSPQQSSENPYQLSKPLIKPLSLLTEQSEKTSEKQIEANLREIYKFYAKQAQSSNKQNTFDQFQQISNVMTLQKFMYFCKDFQLIDLHISNEFLFQHTGQATTKPTQKIRYKHKEKENFVVTKITLVEIFKKCSNISELSFQEFLYALIKIAEVVFPVENSLKIFYDYLGINDPKIYRKKMVIVGKPFNTKDQSEVLTQEKLYSRRLILPSKPKPRAESVRHDEVAINVNNISVQEKPKQSLRNLQKGKDNSRNYIKWEDLNAVDKEFNPRELLLEQDLSDKEDDYYLQEYQITQPDQAKEEIFSKDRDKKIPFKSSENSKHEDIKYLARDENRMKKQPFKLNDNSTQVSNSVQTSQQKLLKQINQQPPIQQSPQTNANQSTNLTPIPLGKQINSQPGRQSIESNTQGYSVKAQMNKLNKVLTKTAINTTMESVSPNTLRKDTEGLNAIKRIEAEKIQREKQIYAAFMKNQELREKKIFKK